MDIISLCKPLVIFICGMQGTRKSSTAVQLAERLKIKVVAGTDQIRDVAKLYDNNPFLKRSTHNCWELIGDRTPDNIINGYLKQSVLIKKAVLQVLELARKRGENIIVEGVHLFPDLYLELQKDPDFSFFHFLLWTKDENLHQENISLKVKLRHGKENNWPEETIENIEEIQKFLLSKVYADYNIYLIGSTTPEKNAAAIIEILERAL